MATIGFIGAGHIGSQLARLAVANGYYVMMLSNSRGPETLTGLVKELGPRARAGTTVDAARSGDSSPSDPNGMIASSWCPRAPG
jgi:predicted dinucleotide-binding enzyme